MHIGECTKKKRSLVHEAMMEILTPLRDVGSPGFEGNEKAKKNEMASQLPCSTTNIFMEKKTCYM